MQHPQEDKNISPKMLDFMQSESLTYALKRLDSNFSLKLVFLGQSGFISEQKADLLDAKAEDRFLVREVNLMLDQTPVIRGKSSCKLTSLFWKEYLDIFNQSLGEKLFSSNEGVKLKSNAIKRTDFLWAYKKPSLNSLISNKNKSKNWSRISVFEHKSEKLVLEEVFLLDLKKFIK